MTKPDWNAIQHPEEKSPEHGKHDANHGSLEHGMGAHLDPTHEHGPKQHPEDASVIEPDEGDQ